LVICCYYNKKCKYHYIIGDKFAIQEDNVLVYEQGNQFVIPGDFRGLRRIQFHGYELFEGIDYNLNYVMKENKMPEHIFLDHREILGVDYLSEPVVEIIPCEKVGGAVLSIHYFESDIWKYGVHYLEVVTDGMSEVLCFVRQNNGSQTAEQTIQDVSHQETSYEYPTPSPEFISQNKKSIIYLWRRKGIDRR